MKALIVLLSWSAVAWAAPDEIDEALRAGVELRRQGRDLEALSVFRAVLDRSSSSRAAAQTGICEQALGRWLDAALHLDAALSDQDDAWIAQNREALLEARSFVAQHLAELDVLGPPGASVKIDGRLVGSLPLVRPLRVVAGRVTLEVTQPGRFPVSRMVTVDAGGLARETVDLLPVPGQPAPAVAVVHAAPSPKRRRTWPWIVAAAVVGAAAVAVGVAVPLSQRTVDPVPGSLATLKEN